MVETGVFRRKRIDTNSKEDYKRVGRKSNRVVKEKIERVAAKHFKTRTVHLATSSRALLFLDGVSALLGSGTADAEIVGVDEGHVVGIRP